MRTKIEPGPIEEKMEQAGINKKQLIEANVTRPATDAIGKDVTIPVRDLIKMAEVLNLRPWSCIASESKEAMEDTLPLVSEQQALLNQPNQVLAHADQRSGLVSVESPRPTSRDIVALKSGNEVISTLDKASRNYPQRFQNFKGNEAEMRWLQNMETGQQHMLKNAPTAMQPLNETTVLTQKIDWISRIPEETLVAHEELFTGIEQTLLSRIHNHGPLQDGIYVGKSRLGSLMTNAKKLVKHNELLDGLIGKEYQVFHHQVKRPTKIRQIEYIQNQIAADDWETEDWCYEYTAVDIYSNLFIIMPTGLDFILIDYFSEAALQEFFDVEAGEGVMDEEQRTKALHTTSAV